MSRHPSDCYLTPGCAAFALRRWLLSAEADVDLAPWLDPFAGAGTLLEWGAPLAYERFAFELDRRWSAELVARVGPMNVRIGRDSLAMPWLVRGSLSAPHVITNPPFGRTLEAIGRAQSHARVHGRWACVLMRTDWWQHPNRSHLRPDRMLFLEWRPAFGLNKKGQLSTDYAGYVWCVWSPEPADETRVEFLQRPEIPDEMRAEHRRLARVAHEMGREMAQGA